MGTEIFMIDKGKRHGITLGARLGGGGEAVVSAVAQLAECAAKIYLPEDLTKPDGPRKGASREKLEAMLRRTPPKVEQTVNGISRPQLAWPSHLVEGPDGTVKGFLMRVASSVDLTSYMSRTQQMNELSANDRSLPRRVLICANLLTAVNEMHGMKHYMVDVKPENIAMFPDTGMLCLLDNDSFSIDDGEKRHPATALTAGYIAPELLRNSQPPAAVMTDWQDRFALAVLIFQVLNNGIHPFQGSPVPGLECNEWNTDLSVKEGWYAYSRKPVDKLMTMPSPFSVHQAWPLALRDMFDKAFTATQGSQRPSPTEWRKLLSSFINANDAFQACAARPEDVTHIHFAGMPCHECLYEATAAKADAENRIKTQAKAEARRLLMVQRAEAAVEEVSSLPGFASNGRGTESMPPQSHEWASGADTAAHAYQAPAAPLAANTAATPPKRPSRRRMIALVIALAMIALFLISNISGKKTEQPAPVAASAPATAANVTLAATTATPLAPSANRTEALTQAMELAAEQNFEDALLIMEAAKNNETLTADQAARTLMRNTAFMQSFNGFNYQRKPGRDLAMQAKQALPDRNAALELQLEAVGLAYEDRELAADLAYYMALERHPQAINASLFALSMPRPANRTATSTGWQALAIALTSVSRASDAEGAMLVALAISPNESRGKFCSQLLALEFDYGANLRPLVHSVFSVIKVRAGTEPIDSNCESPPKWRAR